MGLFQYFSCSFLLFLLSLSLVVAAPPASGCGKGGLVQRCKDLLIILEASSFCSSVLGLHDVTSTVTSTGSTQHTTTTVLGSSCTVTASASTTTLTSIVSLQASTITYTSTAPALTSTVTSTAPPPIDDVTSTFPAATDSLFFTASTPVITSILSTTLPESFVTHVATSTHVVTTTTITTYALANSPAKRKHRNVLPRACNIPKLPPGIEIFACDIISAACSEFVHPHTSTTHITIPGSIYESTITVSAVCAISTPPESFETAYSTITPAALPFTVQSIPPASIVTITTTPDTVTAYFTSTPLDSTTDITVTPQPSTSKTITTLAALTSTIITTTAKIATSTSFILGSTTKTNDCNPATQDGSIDLGFGLTGHYDVRCNTALTGASFVQSVNTASFSACLNYCNNNACDAVQWNIATGECDTYDGALGSYVQNYGFNSANLNIDF